eukprot:4687538-Alexandrium_andersonii.AAC.1
MAALLRTRCDWYCHQPQSWVLTTMPPSCSSSGVASFPMCLVGGVRTSSATAISDARSFLRGCSLTCRFHLPEPVSYTHLTLPTICSV